VDRDSANDLAEELRVVALVDGWRWSNRHTRSLRAVS
jgi:hypothetical protein